MSLLNLQRQKRQRRSEFRSTLELQKKLDFIDGLAFGAYRELAGGWRFKHFDLFIEHLPADQHGPPADWTVWVYPDEVGLEERVREGRWQRIAAADFFLRQFHQALGQCLPGSRGSGIGGLIDTLRPTQAIEEQTACFFDGTALEVRLKAGMPSAGMTILVDEVREMFRQVERAVEATFLPSPELQAALDAHLRTVRIQNELRGASLDRGLIAFVADAAILPRASARSDLPLDAEHVRPFQCPESLRVEIDLGALGRFVGLGLPRGVTVITGGSYHGKSTLLCALEESVHNHIAGDGREAVVSDPLTFRTEAEEGRPIQQLDLSPFLHNLPSHVDVQSFSSDFASGSTSQAANIIEALVAGARVLLIDEDRAASNFMFADEGMRELMKADELTVTSYLQRARELFETRGVSSVIVAGSSSRYFSIADQVLKMEEYVCQDITREARAVAGHHHPAVPYPETPLTFSNRIPLPPEEDVYRGRRFVHCSADLHGLLCVESNTIELSRLPGQWNESHLIAAGLALADLMKHAFRGNRDLDACLDSLERDLDSQGLILLDPFRKHFLRRPTRFQISAALNRFPGLRFTN